MNEHLIPPPDSDDQWEASVKRMAAELLYPPTPDIARKVRQRIERPAPVGTRLAQAAAALILLLSGLMAVPQVRAEVFRIIQIGVITIIFDEPPASSTPLPTATDAPLIDESTQVASTPTPHPTRVPFPSALRSVLELPGETTLAEARESFNYPIVLPTYPVDLGEPDHVFRFHSGGETVVLVWVDPDNPDTPILSLFLFGPNSNVWKNGMSSADEIQVDGKFAIWSEDPHLIEYESEVGIVQRYVTDSVLIWFDHPLTYRLEGAESLEEALKIVQSITD